MKNLDTTRSNAKHSRENKVIIIAIAGSLLNAQLNSADIVPAHAGETGRAQ
jgi:hypothetical protein